MNGWRDQHQHAPLIPREYYSELGLKWLSLFVPTDQKRNQISSHWNNLLADSYWQGLTRSRWAEVPKTMGSSATVSLGILSETWRLPEQQVGGNCTQVSVLSTIDHSKSSCFKAQLPICRASVFFKFGLAGQLLPWLRDSLINWCQLVSCLRLYDLRGPLFFLCLEVLFSINSMT